MTPRQQEIFDYFVEFTGEYGVPPTVRDVCAAFGWTSPNAAVGHLQALASKGWLTHSPGGAHAYVIAKGVLMCPHCGEGLS